AFPAAPHVGEDLGWRGFDRLEPARGEITAEEVTNRILGWLGARDGSRPFFAWLHYWDPHTPYAPPGAVASAFYAGDPFSGDRRLADRPFLQKTHVGKDLMKWLGERRDPEYPSAMYAAEVHFVDRELGRVLRLLEERSLAERTVIVVVGDHGESLGEHEIFYNHIGLYETQLRVPLIVRVPGLPAGVRSATPVTHLDLAPTLAELFGVSLRHRPEGSSLVRLLAGNPAPDLEGDRRLVHEHAYNHQVALRSGVWKLIWPITRKTKNPALIGEPALYDLTTDPNERHDLASERPEVVAELAASLRAWTHVGRVPNGHDPKLNRAAVDRLRALGYLQ
ncbi:MAG: sulfatase family protein, partial [Candidatus Binatia bacterium]